MPDSVVPISCSTVALSSPHRRRKAELVTLRRSSNIMPVTKHRNNRDVCIIVVVVPWVVLRYHWIHTYVETLAMLQFYASND